MKTGDGVKIRMRDAPSWSLRSEPTEQKRLRTKTQRAFQPTSWMYGYPRFDSDDSVCVCVCGGGGGGGGGSL